MEYVIAIILGAAIGAVALFVIKKIQDQNRRSSAVAEAERIVQKAKSEAAKIKKDSETKAKDFETRARKNVEADIHKQKSQLKNKESQLERRLKELEDQFKQKTEDLEKQSQQLKNKEDKLVLSETRIKDLESKAEQTRLQLASQLEAVSGMSQEEARRQLIGALEDQAKQDAAGKIAWIEQDAQKEANQRARKIISQALSRMASEYTSERTVAVLPLANDEMKGKIIGREGRNIRTLEARCGVDLIVDDTPEAVVISGFDPVRRELAKRTIEKLMEDGRVHPARIEEVAEKQKVELMKSLKEEGDRVVMELGLAQIHPELIKILGGLKYRMSHGQNILNHSLEVAYIAGLLASEMGVSVKLARRAGLLHDLGKGIEHTVEGSHAFVGADWAKKYGENEEVCHAIRAHHEEEKPQTALAWIVCAANILSRSRPGARRPQMDSYIQRLKDLESIGNSFDGVLKTFALQAGKDVRVFVESSKVTDDQTTMLCRDIARKIEREISHAGPVKVSVIRETRSVDMAR